VGRGGTTLVREPPPRLAASVAPARRAPLIAAAVVCATACALALGAAGAALLYVAARVVGQIASGDGDNAARWATMAFAAAAPLMVAYLAYTGYADARARLRGEVRPRAGLLALALPAVVIAGALVLQGSLSAGSYFVTDDWLHIAIARDAVSGSGLDLHYLGRIVFIHYAPGHRFAYWLLQELAPLDWSAALAAMLVLFAGSLAVFHRITTRLFGRRPTNLVLLGLFGTSVLLAPSFLWFADGVHKFPSMLLSLIAIDAYLAYRLAGRRWALAVVVVAVSLGSLFYAKTLLVPLYLLLIRVLFIERRPERAWRAILDERWTWIAFVPTYLIYGVNYILNYSDVQAPAPSLHLLGKYLWLAWFRGVTPAFAGVHVTLDAPPSEVLWAVGAQILLVAVIALSIHLKRSAWRAWVFWAIAFGANATVVAMGRLGSLGLKQVGSQLRYDTEMTWLLPLALGFAFFPGEVAGRPADGPRKRLAISWPGRRARLALLALAACAYLAATIDTGLDSARDWRRLDSDQPKAYVENIQRDAARLAREGVSPETIDDQTPAFLIAPTHKPWNRLERLVPAITSQLRVVPAATRPLQVRQDGEVIPMNLQGLSGGPTAISGAGAVTLHGGRRVRSGGRLCAVAGAAPATLDFAAETLLRGQSLFARVDYTVARRSRVPAAVSADSYRPTTLAVPLDRPRGQIYLNLGHRLRATLPAGTRVCVRSSTVGWIQP
jgi:hypothetical protein